MDEITMRDKIELSNTNYNNNITEQDKGKIIISDKKEDLNKHFYYEIRSTSNIIKFDYILFKNFYVASISLLAYCDNESFCLLNNYTLMNDANTEEDSERFFIISSKEFEIDENKFKELKINSLKLFIFQPSLLWNCFYLKNLKIINSLNQNNEQKIYYEISPKNKYIFKEENIHLIDDSEVINQKYIEIASKGGNPYSKLSFID
jgi:hypothetical protein